MYVDMINDVLNYGEVSSPRGNATVEVFTWSGVLTNPRARIVANPARELRLGYAAASVAWNLAQRDDQDILWWNPMGKFVLDNSDGRFYGANYGQRIWPYLMEAIELLKLDADTRRAWVPVWQPRDLVQLHGALPEPYGFYSREGNDVPCTLGFQLRIERESLNMQVVMRSQSLGVFAYDVFFFTVLQELLANTLQLELGETWWVCNSLHFYEKERIRRLEELLYKPPHDSGVMQPLHYDLDTAAIQYESSMKTIMEGWEVLSPDPLEQLMLDGVPREKV